MWWHILITLPVIATTFAIKVPVDDKSESAPNPSHVSIPSESDGGTQAVPVYYTSDQADFDSYLIPPDPHKPQDIIAAETPATFLLPPNEQSQDGYIYSPTQGAQSDWLPMAQVLPEFQPGGLLPPTNDGDLIPMLPYSQSYPPQPIHLPLKIRVEKGLERIHIPVPSTKLEPPLESAENHFIINVPSKELELPKEDYDQQFNRDDDSVKEQGLPFLKINKKFKPSSDRGEPKKLKPIKPTLSLNLLPPKQDVVKPKYPTKLYPKKYGQGFKPIPIPIGQLANESVKPYNSSPSTEEVLTPSDEKKQYLYDQLENKRKLKEKEEDEPQEQEETYFEDQPILQEQEASETFRQPGHNAYSVPLRQAPAVPQGGSAPPPAGDRTEFRMHGMKGPHSYQFGYDTGKGKNRQFRFEERDNDGHVRGHYGYVDRSGKLRVVNYDADPKLGFRAEAEPENKDEAAEP